MRKIISQYVISHKLVKQRSISILHFLELLVRVFLNSGIDVTDDTVAPLFNGNSGCDTTSTKKIEHGRTMVRECPHEPLYDEMGFLSRVSNSFF